MSNIQKAKILIVDDLQINRILLKRIFQDNYDILEASNGAEALEILKNKADISIMLLDLIMPVMDGFGVLGHMNAIPSCLDVPVVVVTACGDADMQIRALKEGAAEVITSPYNPQVILHRVESILFKTRLARGKKALQRNCPIFSGMVGGTALIRVASNSFTLLRANDEFFDVLGAGRETLVLNKHEEQLLSSLLHECDVSGKLCQKNVRRSVGKSIIVNIRAFPLENNTYFLNIYPADLLVVE